MRLASKPGPAQRTYEAYLGYLVRQVERRGIDLRLDEELTAGEVERWNPDAVIAATGVRDLAPSIAGLDDRRVLRATDVLAGAPAEGRVAVVGGGLVGCETALHLAEQGRRVSLVARPHELAPKANAAVRAYLAWAVKAREVAVTTATEALEVTPEGLIVRDGWGERRRLRVDTVVLATGVAPDDRLAAELSGSGPRVLRAGDCQRPRGLRDAIEEAHRAAVSV